MAALGGKRMFDGAASLPIGSALGDPRKTSGPPVRRLCHHQLPHPLNSSFCDARLRTIAQPGRPTISVLNQSIDEADPHQRRPVQSDEATCQQSLRKPMHRHVHEAVPIANVDAHVIALSLDLVDHGSLNLPVTTLARKPQSIGLVFRRISFDRLADEVRFKARCKLSKVRPNAFQLFAILSERRAAPLDDEVVGAGHFQRGVDKRTALNAIFEPPQTIRRGAMIEGNTDDNAEVSDGMLLHSCSGTACEATVAEKH